MEGYSLQGCLKYGGFEGIKYALFNGGAAAAAGGGGGGAFITAFASDHRLPALLLAAGSAELVASLVLCPLEQTRIKMVSDPTYADGLVSAVRRLFADEGPGGVLGSLPAIYTKMVPYTMFQLATYDVASTALRDAAAGFDGVSVPPILIQLPASFLVGPGRYCFKCSSTHLPRLPVELPLFLPVMF